MNAWRLYYLTSYSTPLNNSKITSTIPLRFKESGLKIFSTLLLWITALQLLNMSMCSDAYWYYFNSDHLTPSSGKLADPTETIVEWLVEMKMGQLDCFTYDRNNIDSKNTAKASVLQIDLQDQSGQKIDLSANTAGSEVFYTYNTPKIQTESSEILSPPPDRN